MRKLIELRTEVVRLRVEERLSLKEIEKRTGASRGSLSAWLRDFPLSEEERRLKSSDKLRGNQFGAKPRGIESKFHQAVEASALTNAQRSKISEAAVLVRLCLHGFSPYGSFAEGEKSDWLVVDGERPRVLRIQVRSTHNNWYGVPVIRLQCSNGRGKSRRLRQDEFDFLVGYDLFSDTAFVFSAAELEEYTTAVSVRDDAVERWDKLRAL